MANKTFKEAVSEIRAAERHVDTVLDAARLSRNPIDGNARLEMILAYITAIVAIIATAAFFIVLILVA